MLARRSFVSGAAMLGAGLFVPRVTAAWPLDWRPFEWSIHGEAHTAGVPIAMAFHADWCEVCRAQEPALQELRRDPRYGSFEWMRVDFDGQKDVADKLRVSEPATVVLAYCDEEVGRVVAETDIEVYRELFRKVT